MDETGMEHVDLLLWIYDDEGSSLEGSSLVRALFVGVPSHTCGKAAASAMATAPQPVPAGHRNHSRCLRSPQRRWEHKGKGAAAATAKAVGAQDKGAVSYSFSAPPLQLKAVSSPRSATVPPASSRAT